MQRLILFCLTICLLAGFVASVQAEEADKIMEEVRTGLIQPNPSKPDGGIAERPKKRAALEFKYGPAVMPAYLDLARHKDENVRMNAVLGIGDVLAMRRLAPEALDALAKQAQPVVLERLSDPSFAVRYSAMMVAGAVYVSRKDKDPVTVNRLLGILFSRRPGEEKAGAARGLSRLPGLTVGDVANENPKTVQAAIAHVRKWYMDNRRRLGLISLRPKEDLLAALQSQKPDERLLALDEIQARGESIFLPPVLDLLKTEKDGKVCAAATQVVNALSGLPIKIAATMPAPRRAKIIARWKAWSQVQPAIRTLKVGNPTQRDASARTLASVTEPTVKNRVVDVLAQHIITETDVKTIQTILKTMQTLTGEAVMGFKPSLTTAERTERIQRWRLWAQAAPKVKAAFAEKDPAKRAAAIRSLVQYRHANVVDALIAQLKVEKEGAAIRAITRTVQDITRLGLAVVPGMTAQEVQNAIDDFMPSWKDQRKHFE